MKQRKKLYVVAHTTYKTIAAEIRLQNYSDATVYG